MPECEVHLAELAAYLARAPKSVEVYRAYAAAKADAQTTPNEPIPIHLRNAPTKLMKEIGYGKGYIYNPDVEGPVDQTYLPDKLKGRRYF
jgi:putative ATPase